MFSKNEMFYVLYGYRVDVHYDLHTLLTPYLLVVTSRSHVLNLLTSHWLVAASCGHMPILLCKNTAHLRYPRETFHSYWPF